ncbi:hypothetical protein TruAng_011097 [Truncatella angustata]|nr:hypothetical protein TruAng_011097 [Truncatella angustata]
MVKMSFVMLCLRLLPGHVSQRINQVLLAVLAAEGIEATTVVVFQCRPTWDIQEQGACLDLKLFYTFRSVSKSPRISASSSSPHPGGLEASIIEVEEDPCGPDAFARFVVSK